MLNIQINAIAFSDQSLSNNPFLRNFDLTYKLFGLPNSSSEQKTYIIAPGSTEVLYDGTRQTSIDSTTSFDVQKPYINKNIYRLVYNSGTQPNFRADRLIGIDNTSTFSVTMSGPVATYTNTSGPFNTSNIQVGDVLLILDGAGCSLANSGRFLIISKTANSVSVQNLSGVAETFTIQDDSKFLIFSSGGASNQPQIGDKLLISAGFSPVSHGTYEVVEVTPNWIEVLVGLPGGLPLETNITPGVDGLIIYKAVSKFVLIAAQSSVVARFNNSTDDSVQIDPPEHNNPERPGILLKMGDFYKLTLYNKNIHPANVIVAMTK